MLDASQMVKFAIVEQANRWEDMHALSISEALMQLRA
jgi:hypothetical protein